MAQNNQTLNTLEKIKSFAIALIGSIFTGMGSTYFSQQRSYHVPRILYPIYEIFGNIGLAIGMILLGGFLIYMGYSIFKKNNGNRTVYFIFVMVALLIFYVITYVTNIKPSTEEIQKSLNESQNEQLLSIENAERPSLEVPAANHYLDKLEALDLKFQTAQLDSNEILFERCEKEYEKLLTVEFEQAIGAVSKTKKYSDFLMYNAKVLTRINNIRRQHAN